MVKMDKSKGKIGESGGGGKRTDAREGMKNVRLTRFFWITRVKDNKSQSRFQNQNQQKHT